MSRKVYPTDVTDEEWEFVVFYLTLMKEDAPQRTYALRDVFDATPLDGQGGVPAAASARRFPALAGGPSSRANAGSRPGCLRPCATTCA